MHVNKHSGLIYEANLFNNNFNNFKKSLTYLKCSVELSFLFNVTVDSCMNDNFYVVSFYSLVQFTRLNAFNALTPDSESIRISLDPFFLCFLFFFSMFSYIFLKNGYEKSLKCFLMFFLQLYLSPPSFGGMCSKVKACNQMLLFSSIYVHVW